MRRRQEARQLPQLQVTLYLDNPAVIARETAPLLAIPDNHPKTIIKNVDFLRRVKGRTDDDEQNKLYRANLLQNLFPWALQKRIHEPESRGQNNARHLGSSPPRDSHSEF